MYITSSSDIVETPRGLITLGAQIFGGLQQKGIKSLQECIKVHDCISYTRTCIGIHLKHALYLTCRRQILNVFCVIVDRNALRPATVSQPPMTRRVWRHKSASESTMTSPATSATSTPTAVCVPRWPPSRRPYNWWQRHPSSTSYFVRSFCIFVCSS